MKKIMNKNSPEEVLVKVRWFVSLQALADKYEKNPTLTNRGYLIGYISSAKEIVKYLIVKSK